MKNLILYRLSLKVSTRFSVFVLLVFFGISCSSPSSTDSVELVFAAGPDDTGTTQALIDKFNKEHKDHITVSWNKGSRFSDAFYHEIAAEFSSDDPAFDVVASDVIWTPAFVTNEWVEDLTQRFFSAYEPLEFVEGAMGSVSFHFKVWGLPWYTDAGMLYYRKDLLEQAGFEHPPATWSELISYSKVIQEKSNIKHGYVFQAGDYEGGVANACEFIWNAEGDVLVGNLYIASSFDQEVLDDDLITVNSLESRVGLQDLQKIVASGISPTGITDYREQESGEAFQQGEAAFMRSWASAYGYLLNPESKVKPKQVGLTMIPTSERNMTPYSCLGGWNLMVSAKASEEKKAAAWEFIQFMASEQSQRYRALNAGILPSLRRLYEDGKLLKRAPVIEFARQVIPICKERPRSPFYMEMSPEISGIYTQLIEGKLSPEEAVVALEKGLEEILEKH